MRNQNSWDKALKNNADPLHFEVFVHIFKITGYCVFTVHIANVNDKFH